MKKILIIGATSAIAEAAARIWASRGDALFLVARNEERLDSVAGDLRVRGSFQIATFCMDASCIQKHAVMLDQAFNTFGKIDVALIAYGTLSDQALCEKSVDLTIKEINTNALSVIAMLTQLANRFECQGSGTIAAITSVAGDRGRQSNYIYGSAKAMVATFMSGLRQRLSKVNISVVTIKPGFVDTPMTASFKKGLLWASPNKVAGSIVIACERRNGEVYVPSFWWAIMAIIKAIPEFIFKRLRI